MHRDKLARKAVAIGVSLAEAGQFVFAVNLRGEIANGAKACHPPLKIALRHRRDKQERHVAKRRQRRKQECFVDGPEQLHALTSLSQDYAPSLLRQT